MYVVSLSYLQISRRGVRLLVWWRAVVAVVVRLVQRLLKIAVVSHDSWSEAASTVSVLSSPFERTKFRHLNRPQCKVLPF